MIRDLPEVKYVGVLPTLIDKRLKVEAEKQNQADLRTAAMICWYGEGRHLRKYPFHREVTNEHGNGLIKAP